MYPLSEPKVQYYLDRVLRPEKIPSDDAGPRGIIGVIGQRGSLEAAIMLVLQALWYSDTITMGDCMNYVDPRHRVSHHAKALIEYAKNIVDQVRETTPEFRMIVGVVSNIRTAAKVRLFEKHLASPVGAFFSYPAMPEFVPIKKTHIAHRPSKFVVMRTA